MEGGERRRTVLDSIIAVGQEIGREGLSVVEVSEADGSTLEQLEVELHPGLNLVPHRRELGIDVLAQLSASRLHG